jgi:hypothetical protein
MPTPAAKSKRKIANSQNNYFGPKRIIRLLFAALYTMRAPARRAELGRPSPVREISV